jgi:hypothetical protein
MTVLPPRTPLEGEPMPIAAPVTPPAAPSPARRTTPDRIVVGLLLAAAGAAWLLDEIGVSVPWALAPAVGVVVIGVALMLTARDPGGHALLVVCGAILLATALAVAAVRPVGGAFGDRLVTPTAGQWPVATSVAAGNLTLDLRQNPLPTSGRLTAHVNAGRPPPRRDRRPARHRRGSRRGGPDPRGRRPRPRRPWSGLDLPRPRSRRRRRRPGRRREPGGGSWLSRR